MCQRVVIAIAFACNPVFIVADEPTTALDVTVQHQILRLIRELQARFGTAVLFVTHNPLLSARCDRTIRVEDGQIALD